MQRRSPTAMLRRLSLQHRLSTTATANLPIVDRLNATLEAYPATSFTAHISSSLATFGLAYYALAAVSFDAPALAVAGVVSRMTKRLRTPVDLSLAAMVAHSFPWANRLKLGPLLAAPLQNVAADPTNRFESGLVSLTQWAQGPVNTYGGAYMVIHWLTGLTTVTCVTTAVHYGVDVSQALASLPFIGEYSEASLQTASGTASCVAGAMTINTVALPARLYLLSLYGLTAFTALSTRQAAFWRTYRAWIRVQYRENPQLERRLKRRV